MFEFKGGSPGRLFEGADSDQDPAADPDDLIWTPLTDDSERPKDPLHDSGILPTDDRVPPDQVCPTDSSAGAS